MQRISVSSLGFDLTKEVPSDVTEYNALAPKRENAVLEDAINNTLYRGTLAEFRSKFLEELGTLTGVERAVVKPESAPDADDATYESEGKWYKRILASVNGTVPANWIVLAQRIMDESSFDPSAKERSSDGPAIGKKDLAFAEELFKRGVDKVTEVVKQLSVKLGREIVLGDDLVAAKKIVARALADYRRAKAQEEELKQKAEFGL